MARKEHADKVNKKKPNFNTLFPMYYKNDYTFVRTFSLNQYFYKLYSYYVQISNLFKIILLLDCFNVYCGLFIS